MRTGSADAAVTGAARSPVLLSLTIAAALLFLVASAQHAGLITLSFGAGLESGASRAAAIAEGLSGILLAIGAFGLMGKRAWGERAALVAYIVAILAVLVGITALAGDGGSGVRSNMQIHVVMLVLLISGLVILSALRPRAAK